MGNPKKILLDTNFLIDMFRFRIDFSDLEDVTGARCSLFMVEQSVKELKKIDNKYAKVALKFLESGKVDTVSASGSTADDAISFVAANELNKKDFFVATNDIKLRKKLKESGVRVVHIRARKRLEITS